jgi:hypothetical protein
MMAAQAPAANASAPANTAMDERLAKVEQQLADLQHTAPAAVEKVAKTTSHHVSHAAHKLKHHLVSHHVGHARKHRSSHHHATQPMASRHESGSWVLRAASPGDAWIAKSETASELRHVQVGDDVPGLGHVTAIRQSGDGWVVQGSEGSVR